MQLNFICPTNGEIESKGVYYYMNHPIVCRPPGPLTDPLTDKPEFIVPIVLLVAVVIIILAVVLFIKVKK